MNVHAESPFEAHPDWQNNACISNNMSFEELGDHYVRSADTLVEAAVRDSGLLDVHVYSVCFLYRHGIELILKDLLWKSTYAINGTKGFPKHHRLGCLWQCVHANAKDLLHEDLPFTVEEASQVRQLLAQIEEHDQTSDAFRYPYDKRMGSAHPSLVYVNLRSLYGAVHQMVDLLQKLAARVAYHYEGRSGQET